MDAELKYSKDHAWVKIEGETTVVIGITDFAQQSMGEITYMELPEIGKMVTRGQYLCAIGSSKVFVDLPAPVSGEVVELNEAISATPNLINESPYEKGWFIKLHAVNLDELNDLMDSAAYIKFVESETA